MRRFARLDVGMSAYALACGVAATAAWAAGVWPRDAMALVLLFVAVFVYETFPWSLLRRAKQVPVHRRETRVRIVQVPPREAPDGRLDALDEKVETLRRALDEACATDTHEKKEETA